MHATRRWLLVSAPTACAFCEAPDPAWGYPGQTFTVAPRSAPDHPPLDFGGITWACDRCARYIARDAYAELLGVTVREQVSALVRTLPRHQIEQLIVDVATAYQQFRQARTGPPTRYTRPEPAA